MNRSVLLGLSIVVLAGLVGLWFLVIKDDPTPAAEPPPPPPRAGPRRPPRPRPHR